MSQSGNKPIDGSKEVKLLALLGNYDKQTNGPTDRRTDRLPKIIERPQLQREAINAVLRGIPAHDLGNKFLVMTRCGKRKI